MCYRVSQDLGSPSGRKPWFGDNLDYYFFLTEQQISSIRACFLPLSKTGEKAVCVLLHGEFGHLEMQLLSANS